MVWANHLQPLGESVFPIISSIFISVFMDTQKTHIHAWASVCLTIHLSLIICPPIPVKLHTRLIGEETRYQLAQ